MSNKENKEVKEVEAAEKPVRKSRAKKALAIVEEQVSEASDIKKKRESKVKKQLSKEESVLVFATMNDDINSKIIELANKAGMEVVILDNKIVTDYIASKEKAHNPNASDEPMSDFVNNVTNRREAENTCLKLWTFLTGGLDIKEAPNKIFTQKDVTSKTNLTNSKAKQVFNLLRTFGMLEFLIGSHVFKLHFTNAKQHEVIKTELTALAGVLSSDIARYSSSVNNDPNLTAAQKKDMLKLIQTEIDEIIEY